MSILTQVYAIPSRVRGAYRLMLQAKGQRMKREDLKRILSPETVQSEAGNTEERNSKMLQYVINEMVKMGLFSEQDDDVLLSPSVPAVLLQRNEGDQALPYVIMELFASSENEGNRDFLRLLAWYMMQDAYDAPYDYEQFQVALNEQVGPHKLGCTNSNPYDQFEYWSCFCGFAWMSALKPSEKRLTPDPTEYVRHVLPDLFSGETELLFSEVVGRLAVRCPVFEHGTVRKELAREFQLEHLEENHLSSVSSLAWLRLHEEGELQLHMQSDADVVVLWDGTDHVRYSHVKWNKRKERV